MRLTFSYVSHDFRVNHTFFLILSFFPMSDLQNNKLGDRRATLIIATGRHPHAVGQLLHISCQMIRLSIICLLDHLPSDPKQIRNSHHIGKGVRITASFLLL